MSRPMPVRPTTKRLLVDPRDTFDWSTPNLNVTTRPTDPYVKPAEDMDLISLAQFAKQSTEILSGFTEYQQSLIRKNQTKARAEALRDIQNGIIVPDAESGKPKTFMNLGLGYTDAYYATFGEAAAIKFKQEYLETLAKNNYFVNSDNPEKDKEELFQSLYQKYLGHSTNNDFFMIGASEQFNEAKIQADNAFNEAIFTKRKQDFMNAQSVIIQDTVKRYIDQNGNNPTAFRDLLNNMYETTIKPTNLMTRDEFTILAINYLGQEAINYMTEMTTTADGKTDFKYSTIEAVAKAFKILDILYGVDSKGFNWRTVTKADGTLKFASYIDGIKQSVLNHIEQRQVLDKQKANEQSKIQYALLFEQLMKGKDISIEAERLFNGGNGILQADEYYTILTQNRMAHNQEWSIANDMPYVESLRVKILQGKATQDEIDRGYLTKFNSDIHKELTMLQFEVQKQKEAAARAASTSGKALSGMSILDDPNYKANLTYLTNALNVDSKTLVYLNSIYQKLGTTYYEVKANAIRRFFVRCVNGENPYDVARDILATTHHLPNEKPKFKTKEQLIKFYKSKDNVNYKLMSPQEFNYQMELLNKQEEEKTQKRNNRGTH